MCVWQTFTCVLNFSNVPNKMTRNPVEMLQKLRFSNRHIFYCEWKQLPAHNMSRKTSFLGKVLFFLAFRSQNVSFLFLPNLRFSDCMTVFYTHTSFFNGLSHVYGARHNMGRHGSLIKCRIRSAWWRNPFQGTCQPSLTDFKILGPMGLVDFLSHGCDERFHD